MALHNSSPQQLSSEVGSDLNSLVNEFSLFLHTELCKNQPDWEYYRTLCIHTEQSRLKTSCWLATISYQIKFQSRLRLGSYPSRHVRHVCFGCHWFSRWSLTVLAQRYATDPLFLNRHWRFHDRMWRPFHQRLFLTKNAFTAFLWLRHSVTQYLN